jgi:hypothetical protein
MKCAVVGCEEKATHRIQDLTMPPFVIEYGVCKHHYDLIPGTDIGDDA